MALRELLEMAAGRGGLAHQLAIQDVRDYLSVQPADQVTLEIMGLDRVELLRYLQEAGVRSLHYETYLRRLRGLAGEEEEEEEE